VCLSESLYSRQSNFLTVCVSLLHLPNIRTQNQLFCSVYFIMYTPVPFKIFSKIISYISKSLGLSLLSSSNDCVIFSHHRLQLAVSQCFIWYLFLLFHRGCHHVFVQKWHTPYYKLKSLGFICIIVGNYLWFMFYFFKFFKD
jgi:hypothetical protein